MILESSAPRLLSVLFRTPNGTLVRGISATSRPDLQGQSQEDRKSIIHARIGIDDGVLGHRVLGAVILGLKEPR